MTNFLPSCGRSEASALPPLRCPATKHVVGPEDGQVSAAEQEHGVLGVVDDHLKNEPNSFIFLQFCEFPTIGVYLVSAAAGRLARLEEQLERQRLDRGLRWRLRRVVPVLGVRRGQGRGGRQVVRWLGSPFEKCAK